MGLRYALVSARYAPLTGGVESFTAHVAAALVRGGNDVTVVTSRLTEGASAWETQENGVEVCRLSAIPLMGARLPLVRPDADLRKAYAELTERGFDRVLVSTRFYPLTLFGLALAREVHAPAIVLDHGAAYLTLGSPAADVCLRVWEHAMTAVAKRYQPAFAGVSPSSCAWLETFGIHTTRVIPDGIDAAAYRAQAAARSWKDELGVADDGVLVAFVGRLEPEKGALALAEAARLLDERFTVALVGAGSEEPAIRALGQQNVRLLGTLPTPEVSALFRDADLFCLPSRSEGFCLAYLEAAAWGLASVTTRAGIMGEITEGPAGFGRLIDRASSLAIAEALTSCADAGIRGHSEALAAHVEASYSWDESAAALVSAFEEL